jgi:hypothetical protein
MARRTKRVTSRKTKSKTAKGRTKKPAKRAVAKKSKRAAKKVATKARRGRRVTKRAAVGRRRQAPTPVVEDTVIDIIDEPAPGVVRVTEIEEISVAVPESEKQSDE